MADATGGDGGPTPEWVETTQDTLGSLIQKPKLTTKYLTKPPFRFLHDIVAEVLRTTPLGQHKLFTEDELDAAKAGADKNTKIAFLHKAISLVYFCIPAEEGDLLCTVSPAKIVAGLEPEKTNFFLQMLYDAATSYVSNSEAAVRRVLAGESFEEPRRLVTANKPVKPNTPKQLRPPTTTINAGNSGLSQGAKSEEDPFPPPPPDAPSLAAPTPRTNHSTVAPIPTPGNSRLARPDSAAASSSSSSVARPGSRRGPSTNALSTTSPPPPEQPLFSPPPTVTARPLTAQKRPPKDANPPPSLDSIDQATHLISGPVIVADGDVSVDLSEASQSGFYQPPVSASAPNQGSDAALDLTGSSGIRMTRASKAKQQQSKAAMTAGSGGVPVDPKAVQASLQTLVDEAQAFAKTHEAVAFETTSFLRDIEETKAEIARLEKRLELERKTTAEALEASKRKLDEVAELRREVAAEIREVKLLIIERESKIRETLESIIVSRA